MLTTFDDIKTDVIVKLGISTTEAYYTDAILNDWVQQAHRWATSYKKWPFTEGKVSTTFAQGTEEWSFEGYKADSIRMILIGDKRVRKLNFEDYLTFKEVLSSDTERVYSDYGRVVYINPNIDLSGTLTAYGQYTPVDIDVTDLTATTVFSNGDEEGNEAIVEEVLSYAAKREKKLDESIAHHKNAEAILDGVFGNVEDEQYKYQTSRATGGMFKHLNVVEGDYQDDLFKRNQF